MISLEAIGMTKHFGPVAALDDVSLKVRAGSVHALLGENGAGKSTLVKCIMGYYQADRGEMLVNGQQEVISNPREAHELGIGMVYQHFTLVPNMTVAENLVLSRPHLPRVIDWKTELGTLDAFMEKMPFRIDPRAPVNGLSAGERQKVEILKQLYLENRILILDEPTSVLTPGEADEVLGLLCEMAHDGALSVVMITHKFREVMAFCDDVTVLRRGRKAGDGAVADLTTAQMAEMMIGAPELPRPADRTNSAAGETRVVIDGLTVNDDTGLPAVGNVSLDLRAGEIVGIAGVSGNGQRELVEALSGQREAECGAVSIHGDAYGATRAEMMRHKVFSLPEEPLRNGCVAEMTVAENLAFRNFDLPPFTQGGWLMRDGEIVAAARDLIERFNIKTPGPAAALGTLSGGNVQRTVLARELSGDVDILIVANPCFGLDFAAVSDIRSQIMAARNGGAAVLLVSEDLDELFELADRIVVMLDGEFVFETPIAAADVQIIGQHMAGH